MDTDYKERVLALYPDARCVVHMAINANSITYYIIETDNKLIASSWISEDTAWEYALSITNRKILHMFEK